MEKYTDEQPLNSSDINLNNDNIFQNNLYNLKHYSECQEEDCQLITYDLKKLKEDYVNLENKIFMLEKIRNKQIKEKNKEIDELNEQIDYTKNALENLESCEILDKLKYQELSDLEGNLINLLIKVKREIDKKALDILSLNKDEFYLRKCLICLENDYNIIIRPCKHLCMCSDCIYETINCPQCNVPIESSEKIFLND